VRSETAVAAPKPARPAAVPSTGGEGTRVSG
jgi:hypothetical protein